MVTLHQSVVLVLEGNTMTELKSFRTENGARSALIGEAARIYTPVVYIDSPIKVHRIPNGDIARYSGECAGKRQKPSMAARKMLKAGKRLGITNSAKKFLRKVLKS